MSQENVEIVRRIYAEWEVGNLRAAVHLFDPEIVFESFMPDSPERVVFEGADGIETFTREFLAQVRHYQLTAEELREAGTDTVFVAGRQIAIGRRSGARVDAEAYSVWRFRDGRVIRLTFETDRRRALEVAGLSE